MKTISPPFSFQWRKYMSLYTNRKIFDRVKTAIAETGRINMLSWAEGRDSVTTESVEEIRELPLPGHCRTTACIGGLVCHLATSQEIARTAEIYELSDSEVQEPPLLGAVARRRRRQISIEERLFAALLLAALAT
jgi:hypothetical protein